MTTRLGSDWERKTFDTALKGLTAPLLQKHMRPVLDRAPKYMRQDVADLFRFAALTQAEVGANKVTVAQGTARIMGQFIEFKRKYASNQEEAILTAAYQAGMDFCSELSRKASKETDLMRGLTIAAREGAKGGEA